MIGGGLLGLEAARGLLTHGCEVHVVHLAKSPDGAAARSPRRGAILKRNMEAMGVHVHLEKIDHRPCWATAR